MRDYVSLSRILTLGELKYLEDLIPEGTEHKELRQLVNAAMRRRKRMIKEIKGELTDQG